MSKNHFLNLIFAGIKKKQYFCSGFNWGYRCGCEIINFKAYKMMKKIVCLTLVVMAMLGCSKKPSECNQQIVEQWNNIRHEVYQDYANCETEEDMIVLQTKLADSLIAFAGRYRESSAMDSIVRRVFPSISLDKKREMIKIYSPEEIRSHGFLEFPRLIEYQTQILEDSIYVDFDAPDADDELIRISDLVGKTDYLLIEFWASWCPPCRQAIPELKQIFEEANGRLQIVSVSVDDDREAWLEMVNQLDMNWINVSELKGWDDEATRMYGICAIPYTILLDSKGKILALDVEPETIRAIVLGK